MNQIHPSRNRSQSVFWMTYQLKIVFALLFIYLFIVLLKTNRAKKKKDMQERPDEALNA